jgi:AcrR family transcriptional regulator
MAPTDADDRILDATLAEVGAHGAGGTTIDAIAARAGVARITVFRRFGSKGALIERMVQRELQRFIARLQEDPPEDLAERIIEAFLACLRVSRDNPLAARLVREEPANVFQQLTHGSPSPLDVATAYVAAELGDEARAAALVRLALTYVLVPVFEDDQAARTFAERTLVPLALG